MLRITKLTSNASHRIALRTTITRNLPQMQQLIFSRYSSSSTNPQPPKKETVVEKAIRNAKENLPDPYTYINTSTGKLTEQVKPKPPLLTRIKNEALHYWHGTKLLGTEVGISSRLLLKLLWGSETGNSSLSRREQRQVNINYF